MYTRFWSENLKGRDSSEDICVGGKIILEWSCGLDSSGAGQGPVAGSCEDGNKLSDSINGGEFFD